MLICSKIFMKLQILALDIHACGYNLSRLPARKSPVTRNTLVSLKHSDKQVAGMSVCACMEQSCSCFVILVTNWFAYRF
uniref:Uncharacterized protein n=1 Tax=Arundo donax TaxID=35708 RepID=A0A0A9HF39_ARUDO